MKKITITPAQIARLLQTGGVTIRRPIYKGPTANDFKKWGAIPLEEIPCEWYPSMITEKGVEVVGLGVYGFLHPTDKTKAWKFPFGAPGDKIIIKHDRVVLIETITVKLARSRYVWEIGLKLPGV